MLHNIYLILPGSLILEQCSVWVNRQLQAIDAGSTITACSLGNISMQLDDPLDKLPYKHKLGTYCGSRSWWTALADFLLHLSHCLSWTAFLVVLLVLGADLFQQLLKFCFSYLAVIEILGLFNAMWNQKIPNKVCYCEFLAWQLLVLCSRFINKICYHVENSASNLLEQAFCYT